MRISDVIKRKGGQVVTVRPDDTIQLLLRLLAENGIGAVVVSQDGRAVDGIVSERDVVRRLHAVGADVLATDVLATPVSQIMTTEVETCGTEVPLTDLMVLMTDKRIRHVPVVVDGALRGIVSIGDVVKHRIDELQLERDQLVGYINQ